MCAFLGENTTFAMLAYSGLAMIGLMKPVLSIIIVATDYRQKTSN
jgi:hypothetical protein